MDSSMFILLAICLGAAYETRANTCLSSHNTLRQLHEGTANLEWDPALAEKAQEWAENLVKIGYMKHSDVSGEGENIYYSKSKSQAPCVDASLSWYNEIKDYNYNYPGFSAATGHFTQLVWKDSKKLGVGIASSLPDTSGYITTFIVAKYTPKGNLYTIGYEARDFAANVARQKPGAAAPTRYQLDPSLCKDNSGKDTCTSYKSYGFCETYKDFIGQYCAKTCGIC